MRLWAVVVGRHRDLLTLRYRDYPDHPNFVRRPSAVALIAAPGRASIQGCKFAGIRGCFFVISALYLPFAETRVTEDWSGTAA
jgi:hypothetical protein